MQIFWSITRCAWQLLPPVEKSSKSSPALEFSPPKTSPTRAHVEPSTGPLGFSTPVASASGPEDGSRPHLLWPFPDERAEEFACRLAAKSSPLVADEMWSSLSFCPRRGLLGGKNVAPALTARGCWWASGRTRRTDRARPRYDPLCQADTARIHLHYLVGFPGR